MEQVGRLAPFILPMRRGPAYAVTVLGPAVAPAQARDILLRAHHFDPFNPGLLVMLNSIVPADRAKSSPQRD